MPERRATSRNLLYIRKSQARYLKRRKIARETKQYEADVMQIAKRLAYLPVILSAVLLLRNSKRAVKTKGKSSKM